MPPNMGMGGNRVDDGPPMMAGGGRSVGGIGGGMGMGMGGGNMHAGANGAGGGMLGSVINDPIMMLTGGKIATDQVNLQQAWAVTHRCVLCVSWLVCFVLRSLLACISCPCSWYVHVQTSNKQNKTQTM